MRSLISDSLLTILLIPILDNDEDATFDDLTKVLRVVESDLCISSMVRARLEFG